MSRLCFASLYGLRVPPRRHFNEDPGRHIAGTLLPKTVVLNSVVILYSFQGRANAFHRSRCHWVDLSNARAANVRELGRARDADALQGGGAGRAWVGRASSQWHVKKHLERGRHERTLAMAFRIHAM